MDKLVEQATRIGPSRGQYPAFSTVPAISMLARTREGHPSNHEIDAQVDRLQKSRLFEGDLCMHLIRDLIEFHRASDDASARTVPGSTKKVAKRRAGWELLQDIYAARGHDTERIQTNGPREIGHIRSRLDRYYREAPRNESIVKITFSDERFSCYRPSFEYVKSGSAAGPFTEVFWAPYFGNESTLVIYGVPLFAKSIEKGVEVFKRRVNINDKVKLKKDFPNEKLYPTFVNWGDMLAVMETEQWLRDQHLRWERKDVDSSGLLAKVLREKVKGLNRISANAIVIGSACVNGIIREYQDAKIRSTNLKLRFRLDVNTEKLHSYNNNGKHEGVFGERAEGDDMIVPAVVTRRTGVDGGFITMIASNHGRAVHHIARMLTTEHGLQVLLQNQKFSNWNEMPHTFQIRLEVTLQDNESVATDVEVVDVWRLPKQKALSGRKRAR